ncbi:hypothetical protein SVIO_018470 [Streptomyces violaceusniger]|uniref:Bacterial transcriptional activator domain-containing protein n=1 Tax=Streptomyces violaceusniger TaxID=68280 RepID=A0A4D4KSR1_STRVO|nr:hypothetical protein SVIO_018470 [Streptomyces violaceusniger]
MSTDHIVEATTPDPPPTKRANAVHVRVSRLRSLFRSLAGPDTVTSVISTQPGGYRLVPAEVDSEQFEKLLAAAMRERDKGYLDGAAVRLERALSLWEGDAFSDADAGDCVAAEADRLAELRLVALEEQTDVMLAMGAHAQVVSRLKPLIERYPLRETLYRHLMSALHQSGRPAEALAVYADLRAKLAEELGTEPTPDVQRLYRALLSPQPKHHGSTAVWPSFPVPANRRAPSQLPGDIADFVPCETTDVLAPALTASDRTTTAVTAITGQGGAGKTATAVHLAHRLRPWFPDGQLYVDLGAAPGTPLTPRPRSPRCSSRWTTRCRRCPRGSGPRPPASVTASAAGASSRCSTTRPTRRRSGICCRATWRARSSSPAGRGSPASPSPPGSSTTR